LDIAIIREKEKKKKRPCKKKNRGHVTHEKQKKTDHVTHDKLDIGLIREHVLLHQYSKVSVLAP
jgi:hypothetical protein